MGSKDIPTVSFSHKRAPSITNSKAFPKKSDYITNKYKNKNNKIRTRNERPDIFLEGEQLSKINSIWQNDIDFRYFQNLKQRMRKNTPSSFEKNHINEIPSHKVEGPRVIPNKTELDLESQLSKTSQFKQNRCTTNSLLKDQHYKSNHRIHSTDRQRTTG